MIINYRISNETKGGEGRGEVGRRGGVGGVGRGGEERLNTNVASTH